jgi:hypothetical protein
MKREFYSKKEQALCGKMVKETIEQSIEKNGEAYECTLYSTVKYDERTAKFIEKEKQAKKSTKE